MPKKQENEPKKSKNAIRFIFVGTAITLFNYGLYALLARIIDNNDLLWVSTMVSTFITTFVAYYLHSKITWKERRPGKYGIYNFFIWNLILTFAISPLVTYLFTLTTPLYDLAFNISTAIHLPFDYDFIESTCVFVLTSLVIMVINFIFYDRFIFGKSKKEKEEEK